MIRVRSLAVVGLCLMLGLVLAAVSPALPAFSAKSVSGQEVSGVYSIQQSSDAGTDTQATLSVSLTNSSDATLQCSHAALRSLLSGTTQDVSASFSLPPQGTADFTATVTISQAEFKQWQQGARPTLVLELQSSDGTKITRTLGLVLSVHAEAN